MALPYRIPNADQDEDFALLCAPTNIVKEASKALITEGSNPPSAD